MNNNTSQSNIIFNSISTQAITLKAIHLIIVVFSYFYGFASALLHYDPFRSSNILSSHTPNFQLLAFVFKAVVVPALARENTMFVSWFVVICSVILSCSRLFCLLQSYPYYYYYAMNISLIFTSITTLISIVSLFSLAFRDTIMDSGVTLCYIEALLSILLIKICNIIIEYFVRRYQAMSDNNLTSETDVLKKLFALTYSLQKAKVSLTSDNKNNINELQIKGALKFFLTEKYNIQSSTYDISKSKDKISDIIITELLINSIRRIKRSNTLRLIAAHYLIQEKNNIPMAGSYLLEISQSRSIKQIMALRLLYSCEQRLLKHVNQTAESSEVDLRSLVNFEIIASRFTELIFSTSQKFIQFWEIYTKPNLEIMNLLQRSGDIETNDILIKKQWEKEIRPQRGFARLLSNLYSSYLFLVRNSPHAANQIYMKYVLSHILSNNVHNHHAENILNNTNLLDPKSVVINVSMNNKKPGEIIYTSSNVTEHLGWLRKDLVGTNIVNIMTHLMREKHKNMFKNYSKSGYMLPMSKTLNTFILTKKGFIKPAYVFLAINPLVQDGIKYTLVIRMKQSQTQKIILDKNGRVEGMTEDIANNLLIQPHQRLSVFDICKSHQDLDIFQLRHSFDSPYTTKGSYFGDDGVTIYSKTDRRKNSSEAPYVEIKKEVNLDFYEGLDEQLATNKRTIGYYGQFLSIPFFDTFFYVLSLKRSRHASSSTFTDRLENKKKKLNQLSIKIENEFDENIPQEKDPKEITSVELNSAVRFMHTGRSQIDTLRFISSPLSGSKKATDDLDSRVFLNENKDKESVNEDKEGRKSLSISINSAFEEELDLDDKAFSRDHDGKSISSMSMSIQSENIKLEKFAFFIPPEPRLRLFSIFLFLFCALCGFLLIGFQIRYSSVVTRVAENTMIASNSTRRLAKVVEVYGWAVRFELCQLGIAKQDRLHFLIPGAPLIAIIRDRMIHSNKQLAIYNNVLRDSVHLIDKRFQSRFFEGIQVIESDPINNVTKFRTSNSFDLISSIIAAAGGLSSKPFTTDYIEDLDLKFIKNNTLNDLLLYGEDVASIVVDDSHEKLESVHFLLIKFTIISGILSLTLLCLFVLLIRRSIFERTKFFNVFLRLGEQDIKRHLSLVSKFCNLLQKNNLDGRNVDSMLTKHELKAQLEQVKITQLHKMRIANSKNINRQLIKITLLGALLTGVLFIGFIFPLPVIYDREVEIKENLQIIFDSDQAQYESYLMMLEVYEYITTNVTSKVRGINIREQWDISMEKLKSLQSKFIKLTAKSIESGTNQKVVQILTGNVCEILIAFTSAAAGACSIAFNGLTQKGSLQITEYMLPAIQATRDMFDLSAKTEQDMIDPLEIPDFVKGEAFAFSYWLPTYEEISNVVRDGLKENLNTFDRTKGVLFIVWGVFYLIIGLGGWWKIMDAFDKERGSWRKMMRLIPTTIITTNKMLKSYLSANIQNTFSGKYHSS